MQSKVNTTLDELQKDFKYYRLSLFAFSMSSLIEIMLSGNFKEEYISGIKDEIESIKWMDNDEELLFSQENDMIHYRAVGFVYGRQYIVRIAKVEVEEK